LCEVVALRKIVRIEGEEVTGDWRKLHDEKLHYLYWPPDITGVMKSRSISWEGMGRGENHPGFRWGNVKGGHLEDHNVNGRIILK
jgi:hypothetical protein